ncbi:MAG: hypothetical protein HWE22_00925 [Flavobacteriales bacterium]|nr:hypothetical protein [Flavobacteriales bacterium]
MDDTIVLAVNFLSLNVRQSYATKSFDEIKSTFKGKTIEIEGAKVRMKTNILDVDVSSSLANFRTIFLKIPQSPKTMKIQVKDELRIEL